MMKSILLRSVPLLLTGALLTACGGGGGGGDIASGGSSTGPDVTTCDSTFLNPYLPLTENTSINYAYDVVSGEVACDATLTDSTGVDIYSISYQFGDQALTLYISSQLDSVLLYGIDGPIDVYIPNLGTKQVDQLRFDTPVVISDNGVDIVDQATTARAKLSGASITINLTYDKSESDNNLYPDNGLFGDGDLNVKLASLSLDIVSVKILGITTAMSAGINTNLWMAKGIGVVKHQHSGVGMDFDIESDISSLTGLPNPIWLNYDNSGFNDPTVVSSDGYFSINGTAVNPANYTLVNGSTITANGWVSVVANTSAGTFDVYAQYDAALESLDYPYSVQVLFENKTTGKQVSTNITIDN